MIKSGRVRSSIRLLVRRMVAAGRDGRQSLAGLILAVPDQAPSSNETYARWIFDTPPAPSS